MIIENLTTLKINQLTQAQYETALAAGTINENELYMTEETNVDLTNFANHTLITIPAGRMRGDIDGDGKFTQNDVDTLFKHISGEEILTDSTQLLCCDANSDGVVDGTDINFCSNLVIGSTKAGKCTEVTGNWTNNPNYATEYGQFYSDIPITGMTANHSASVIVKGTYENGFFPKAECIEGAIRIYAKLCPISALTAVVSWGSGDGTAVITTESEDLTVYDEHITNADVHVTADEKALFSEKEIFMAVYGTTTSAEIEAAYQAGRAVYCINGSSLCQLISRVNTILHKFLDITNNNIVTCFNNRWNLDTLQVYPSSHASSHASDGYDAITPASIGAAEASAGLPTVTADDNGKILKVVDGVWTAVTPS